MAEWREQVVGLLTEIRDLLAAAQPHEHDDTVDGPHIVDGD